MNTRWLAAISLVVGLLGYGASVAESMSAGPPPGASGVPQGGGFAAELTCASADCHNSSDANADTLGKVVLSGVPATYVPGQKYRLTFAVSHPSATRWGFQLTAVSTATFRGAGDFSPLQDDTTTQRLTGGEGERVYIEHGNEGRLGTGIGKTKTYSWQFEWIAPQSGVGEVAFYGSGNAANGDGSPAGDSIYSPGMPLATSKSE